MLLLDHSLDDCWFEYHLVSYPLWWMIINFLSKTKCFANMKLLFLARVMILESLENFHQQCSTHDLFCWGYWGTKKTLDDSILLLLNLRLFKAQHHQHVRRIAEKNLQLKPQKVISTFSESKNRNLIQIKPKEMQGKHLSAQRKTML